MRSVIEAHLVADDVEDAVAHLQRHAVRQFGLRRKRQPTPIKVLGEKPLAEAVRACARLPRAKALVLAGSLMGGEIETASRKKEDRFLSPVSSSVITHEAIKTTLPKAKELRMAVEPLITLAKNATLANRRLAFDRTRDRDVVSKLFNDLGPRYKARPGGYTRILKMGYRVGDNAPMALVELVDRPEPTEQTEAPTAE